MAVSLIINGETIPAELFQEEFDIIKAGYERMGAMSCCERDPEFRDYARENVIARVLLNQEAETRFPTLAQADLDACLERLATEHGGIEALCQRVGVSGPEDPLLIQDLSNGVRMDKLILSISGMNEAPSEAELRAFYTTHITDYLTPEKIRATHLFKQVERVEDRDTIYNHLRKLRQDVRKGADFTPIATAETDKEDKVVDLGWFGRGEFSDEFDLIMFSLEMDEISPVFASHWGFHLAQVTGREDPAPKPFESIQEELTARFSMEKRQAATQQLVDELKQKASILETV
jgi:peptidyl-prolyl cis-trans isomerase C